MKFVSILVAASAAFVAANPLPATEAEAAAAATITDVATVGFASTNGGTTGGKGGTTTTVSSLAQFTAAVAGTNAAVVVVSGTISGAAQVRVGSNKSIIGRAGSQLVGVGLFINKSKNVIVRNMKISKVLAENGDAIGVQASTNVWLDHNDLSSDLLHDKDFYDGLIDITHACDWVTVSNNFLHDHWKGSLVGHSDSNAAEDTGHLTVTYVGNKWENINSRSPSLRFGTGHIFNSYFHNVSDGINTRDGAEILVQNNVWDVCKKPLYSTDDGFAVTSGDSLTSCTNAEDAEKGTISASSLPYSFSLMATSSVEASVNANAGQKLAF